MSDNTATDGPQAAPAVVALLDPEVGRLRPKRAEAACVYADMCNASGDCTTGCQLRKSLTRGCSECAWGKVLGCWRCGGR